MAAQLCGFVEVALAESGPPATLALRRRGDGKARRFEHGHGGHADVRLVVAREGVVPKNDPAAGRGCGRLMFGKPMIEPHSRETRQRAPVRNVKQPAAGKPHRQEIQKRIGQTRHFAAPPAQFIHRTEQPFAQLQSITPDARVKQFRLQQRQVHVGRAFRGAGPAGQAIAQCRLQLLRAQRVALDFAQFEHRANGIRAAAGGHDFLAGRNERGTHGRRLLQATAAAVALFQIGGE